MLMFRLRAWVLAFPQRASHKDSPYPSHQGLPHTSLTGALLLGGFTSSSEESLYSP